MKKSMLLAIISFFIMKSIHAQSTFKALDLSASGIALPIQFLSPITEENDSLYPAVLFLHGSGERGQDNQKQLLHGGDFFLQEKNRRDFPCFVFFPQCPDTLKWVNYPYDEVAYSLEDSSSLMMRQLVKLVDYIIQMPHVDRRRIYVMGLSMGGFATWELAYRQSDVIAAVVPICGGADPSHTDAFSSIPSRMYHGEKDSVIKVEHSKRIQDKLTAAGSTSNVMVSHELILYPLVDHNSWDNAFLDEQLLPWLFDQRK